jgi:hypothetical protein
MNGSKRMTARPPQPKYWDWRAVSRHINRKTAARPNRIRSVKRSDKREQLAPYQGSTANV